MSKVKKSSGMTLIEVIIVVSIISFLIIAITVYLRTQIFKANDARRKAETKRIGIALEEYEKDNDCYPLSVICKPGTGLLPYLDKVPCDPVSGGSYLYEPQEGTICPKWYRVYSILENENDVDHLGYVGPFSAFSYVYSSPNAPEIVPAASPTSTPIPTATSTSDPNPSDYYGCFDGVCRPILWDPSRPGPECEISYNNSNCQTQCQNPNSQCLPWDR